ncbi:hypothetical protein WJX84_007936 [Apatococcus fuscideae]|uniref:Telomere length regulation protein TEL2 homolog n=1 Tax=Apatococcus fuscideae TaxID=2026836 RepID=A0AAW1TKW4_9CHLO
MRCASEEDLCELGAPSSAASEALQRLEVVEGLLNRETAAGLFWPDQLVFGRPFDFLAEVLLSVVGPVWLPRLRKLQQEELFSTFFKNAPAAVALTALTSHLSTVRPVGEQPQNGATITIAAADVSVNLLVQRFAHPSSSGIQELVLQHAGCGSPIEENDSTVPKSPLCQRGKATTIGPRAGRVDWVQHASMLVGMSDTCAGCTAPNLRIKAFVPHLLSQLLTGLSLSRTLTGASQASRQQLDEQPQPSNVQQDQLHHQPQSPEGSQSSEGPQPQRQQPEQPCSRPSEDAWSFVAETLSRLCRRGHASYVAQALWQAGLHQAFCPAFNADSSGLVTPECTRLRRMLLDSHVLQRPGIRYLLAEKLLLQPLLPPAALKLLVKLLASLLAGNAAGGREDAAQVDAVASLLLGTASHLAQVWGDTTTISRLPVTHLAYQTAALEAALEHLQKPGLDATGGLLPALLQGVSNRLNSPSSAVRRQGMQVGRALSILLDPSQEPLFENQGPFALQSEEYWHASCAASVNSAVPPANEPPDMSPQAAIGNKDDGVVTDTDSDDDGSSPASEDGFEAYDLTEDDSTEKLSKDGRPLQLRDIAAALRKTDDPQGIAPALRAAEALVAANPDELSHYAGELSRSLLYTRPPEWAEQEAATKAAKPGAQRMRTLVNLLAQEPFPAGDALLGQLWTPHLDTHQRVLILDALSSAAHQMAHGPRALPEPPSRSPASLPDSSQDHPASDGSTSAVSGRAADGAVSPGVVSGAAGPGVVEGGNRAVKTRVWGHRSLARAGRSAPRSHKNRLPEVVLHWAAGLLTECGKERHGVDLFGRDSWLLGQLLLTLGTFAECTSPAPATVQLSGALVELLRTPAVHRHPEAYVRRAALIAVSQVIRAMPPSRLAGAILASDSNASSGDGQDVAVVERLEWVRQFARDTASADADPECRMLGAACSSLQAQLAGAALEHMPSQAGITTGPSLLAGSTRSSIALPLSWQPVMPSLGMAALIV